MAATASPPPIAAINWAASRVNRRGGSASRAGASAAAADTTGRNEAEAATSSVAAHKRTRGPSVPCSAVSSAGIAKEEDAGSRELIDESRVVSLSTGKMTVCRFSNFLAPAEIASAAGCRLSKRYTQAQRRI